MDDEEYNPYRFDEEEFDDNDFGSCLMTFTLKNDKSANMTARFLELFQAFHEKRPQDMLKWYLHDLLTKVSERVEMSFCSTINCPVDESVLYNFTNEEFLGTSVWMTLAVLKTNLNMSCEVTRNQISASHVNLQGELLLSAEVVGGVDCLMIEPESIWNDYRSCSGTFQIGVTNGIDEIALQWQCNHTLNGWEDGSFMWRYNRHLVSCNYVPAQKLDSGLFLQFDASTKSLTLSYIGYGDAKKGGVPFEIVSEDIVRWMCSYKDKPTWYDCSVSRYRLNKHEGPQHREKCDKWRWFVTLSSVKQFRTKQIFGGTLKINIARVAPVIGRLETLALHKCFIELFTIYEEMKRSNKNDELPCILNEMAQSYAEKGAKGKKKKFEEMPSPEFMRHCLTVMKPEGNVAFSKDFVDFVTMYPLTPATYAGFAPCYDKFLSEHDF